jgi:Bacterial regulatory proteins, tetR family
VCGEHVHFDGTARPIAGLRSWTPWPSCATAPGTTTSAWRRSRRRIAEPSIYNHFGSKADLLEAMFDRGTQTLQLGLIQALATAGSPAQAGTRRPVLRDPGAAPGRVAEPAVHRDGPPARDAGPRPTAVDGRWR